MGPIRYLAVAAALVASSFIGANPAVAATPRTNTGTVMKIVDGDTIDVAITGVTYRVRVLGIDTPEIYNGVECGGRSASKVMKRILPIGATVTLASDPRQARVDRFGRLLRYVSQGHSDVGLSLVKRGWARAYVYNGHPFSRAAQYVRAAASAKLAGRGVWAHCGGF
jgi:micrococcal nuclease